MSTAHKPRMTINTRKVQSAFRAERRRRHRVVELWDDVHIVLTGLANGEQMPGLLNRAVRLVQHRFHGAEGFVDALMQELARAKRLPNPEPHPRHPLPTLRDHGEGRGDRVEL